MDEPELIYLFISIILETLSFTNKIERLNDLNEIKNFGIANLFVFVERIDETHTAILHNGEMWISVKPLKPAFG